MKRNEYDVKYSFLNIAITSTTTSTTTTRIAKVTYLQDNSHKTNEQNVFFIGISCKKIKIRFNRFCRFSFCPSVSSYHLNIIMNVTNKQTNKQINKQTSLS